jgi:hypothetical protein
LRIGLALAPLVTVRVIGDRLAWRTSSGIDYRPSTGELPVQDFASIFELTEATLSGPIDEPLLLLAVRLACAPWSLVLFHAGAYLAFFAKIKILVPFLAAPSRGRS